MHAPLRFLLLGSSLLLTGNVGSRASDESFRAAAEREIAAYEYRASVTQSGLQAPNRAHGLRTFFRPGGVELHDRFATDAKPLAALTLSGVGRGDRLAPIAPGELAHDGARVEIRRPGLVEWYVNSPSGLEQGFTLAAAVPGAGELVLELELDGAEATPIDDGAVRLRSANGRGIRYDHLAVADARGDPLPARIELASATRLRLVVDDRAATYPISVDPLFSSTFDAKLTSGQVGAHFGASLAPAGDVNRDGYADVVVGAPDFDSGEPDEGAAFVFNGGPNGLVTGGIGSAAAVLQSNQMGGHLGASVSAGDVEGDGYDDVIVGAPGFKPTSNPTVAGAVFIYSGGGAGIASGGPPAEGTILDARAPDGSVSAVGFGSVVASAGDVNGDGYDDVLVSALYAGFGTPSPGDGAVILYLGGPGGIASGSQLASAARLLGAPNSSAGTALAGGCDVDGDGYDDVVIGAPTYPNGSDRGAVTVHRGGPFGLSSGQVDSAAETLLVSTAASTYGGFFGIRVACAGDVNGDGFDDVAAVSSYTSQIAGTGFVYVYRGSASGIADGSPGTASQSMAGLAADTGRPALCGAGDVNGDGFSDLAIQLDTPSVPGAVQVLLGSPTSLRYGYAGVDGITNFTLLDFAGAGDVNGDGFDDILVGERNHAGSPAVNQQGAAYLILGNARPAPLPLNLSQPGDANRMQYGEAGASLGFVVASAGDVNGDGFDDRILGAPSLDYGGPDAGGVFVFLGSANPNAVDDLGTVNGLLLPEQTGSSFGSSIASAGDVNGDGYADVIVGAQFWTEPEYLEGAAFVYHGGPFGLFVNVAGKIVSNQYTGGLGHSVGGAGDVNGDGYADVIVNGLAANGTNGAALVFYGGPAGIGERIPATANATIELDQAVATNEVGSAGDVNRDGFSDVYVSSTGYSHPEFFEGAIFVFHGGASGTGDRTPASANTVIDSNQLTAQFGRVVAPAGDVNADGYADLIVGFPVASTIPAAYVHLGSAIGIPSGALTSGHPVDSFFVSGASDRFGSAVAGLGDLDGDGFGDIAVGDFNANSGRGAAYVYNGNATATYGAKYSRYEGTESGGQFGFAVGGAGDSNGDGFADLLIGAPSTDAGITNQGFAHLLFGNGLGRLATRRQFTTSAATQVVPPGGVTETTTSAQLEIRGSYPGGKGSIRSEIQMCPATVAFGGAGCLTQLSPWLVVNPSLTERVISWNFTGLAANTRYRWRARVQHSDDTGPLPDAPHHGPWRRPLTPQNGYDLRTARDFDGDGIVDMADNCPYVANPGQQDSGGLNFGPDGIGDACQCGNVAGNGQVYWDDVAAYRAALASPTGAALAAAAQTRCQAYRSGPPCGIVQVSVLRRALATPTPGFPVTTGPAAQFCAAAFPP